MTEKNLQIDPFYMKYIERISKLNRVLIAFKFISIISVVSKESFVDKGKSILLEFYKSHRYVNVHLINV